MQTKEFNALPLAERTRLVFSEGKLIEIFENHNLQKGFFYKYNGLKIDVIYDKARNQLQDVIAWENSTDRVSFLKIHT
jgi:hypothetical protein